MQLCAADPVVDVAERLDLPANVVRYSLHAMKRDGVIRRRPMTDVHLMGFTQYAVFFTPFFQKDKTRQELLRFLIESERTSDIFELGGDYRYGVVLTVRDVQEVYVFLSSLAKLKGVEIIEKSLGTRISCTLFRRGYLGEFCGGPEHITYRRSEQRIDLDVLDHAILRAMHLAPDASLRQLAATLRLAHTSIADRIKRLEEAKVILGYVYGISSQRLGMESYRLIIHTKGFDYDSWQKLFKFASRNPNILCLFQCIGSWDYEFEVEVENRLQLSGLSQAIHELLEGTVLSVKTLPIFSFPKSSGYPFPQPFQSGEEHVYIQ